MDLLHHQQPMALVAALVVHYLSVVRLVTAGALVRALRVRLMLFQAQSSTSRLVVMAAGVTGRLGTLGMVAMGLEARLAMPE